MDLKRKKEIAEEILLQICQKEFGDFDIEYDDKNKMDIVIKVNDDLKAGINLTNISLKAETDNETEFRYRITEILKVMINAEKKGIDDYLELRPQNKYVTSHWKEKMPNIKIEQIKGFNFIYGIGNERAFKVCSDVDDFSGFDITFDTYTEHIQTKRNFEFNVTSIDEIGLLVIEGESALEALCFTNALERIVDIVYGNKAHKQYIVTAANAKFAFISVKSKRGMIERLRAQAYIYETQCEVKQQAFFPEFVNNGGFLFSVYKSKNKPKPKHLTIGYNDTTYTT